MSPYAERALLPGRRVTHYTLNNTLEVTLVSDERFAIAATARPALRQIVRKLVGDVVGLSEAARKVNVPCPVRSPLETVARAQTRATVALGMPTTPGVSGRVARS